MAFFSLIFIYNFYFHLICSPFTHSMLSFTFHTSNIIILWLNFYSRSQFVFRLNLSSDKYAAIFIKPQEGILHFIDFYEIFFRYFLFFSKLSTKNNFTLHLVQNIMHFFKWRCEPKMNGETFLSHWCNQGIFWKFKKKARILSEMHIKWNSKTNSLSRFYLNN